MQIDILQVYLHLINAFIHSDLKIRSIKAIYLKNNNIWSPHIPSFIQA